MAVLRERRAPEQYDFVKAVDAFCERECPPHKLREMTAGGTVAPDDTLYRRLAATGWLGLTIPEEYGGSGGELSDVALLTERLSYHRLPVTGYLTTVITAQALLLRFGTEEQKQRVLPGVAQGDVLSLAITEPDTGSDAAAVRTHARRDGDGWRINGEKIYTSNANHARWVLVVTRTNPDASKHRGISLFLVPMDRVDVTKLDTLGHIDTTITRYADVRATEADIVGGIDAGWQAPVEGAQQQADDHRCGGGRGRPARVRRRAAPCEGPPPVRAAGRPVPGAAARARRDGHQAARRAAAGPARRRTAGRG